MAIEQSHLGNIGAMTRAWRARLPFDPVRAFLDWWAGELSDALGARPQLFQSPVLDLADALFANS